MTISKPLSQNREITVCSSVYSPSLTVSVSVCAAKNHRVLGCVPPQQHSQPVLPGPGPSLPFVLLKPPATSSLHVYPHSSRFQSGGAVLKSFPCFYQSVSLCPVPSVGGFCALWAWDPRGSLPLSLSSSICLQNHGSLLHTSKPTPRDTLFVEITDISSYISG